MWVERLSGAEQARERLVEALELLWPYALGMLDGEQREELVRRVSERLPFFAAAAGEPPPEATRGRHSDELAALWEEMTMVRRLAPGGQW
jgi:1,2-phenylacetyl-CoA epoxidase catalytic subunit